MPPVPNPTPPPPNYSCGHIRLAQEKGTKKRTQHNEVERNDLQLTPEI